MAVDIQETIGGEKIFKGRVLFQQPVTFTSSLSHTYVKTAVKTTGTLAITDVGYLLVVNADAQTLTLPATVVGYVFTVMNGGSGHIVTIAPNASDKIMGAGLTAQDNKALINTAATAKVGDYVTLIGDGADGWYVLEMAGTWARQG